MVIFLSNFLALLIKADTAGEGSRSFLGGVMVGINVLLIVAVLSASCLTTQQTVGDHLEGQNVVTDAGTMLAFEQRTAAKARFTREQTAVPTTLVQDHGSSTNGVDSFNRGKGFSAHAGTRLSHEARLGGTSGTSVSSPTVEEVAHISHDRREGVDDVS